ncbi:hypothetical protein BDN71DRAFT_1508028 [Pleurotus eryngii]|uniref:Uncharacterized protein n=1 Tax=Pleurotus eryngii TaxID=5323 RepID=A0A9P5ZU26_PLEER|nr:hypothetical protein BDN71DRAFT_1508028 [Pleurotus eryngii]
MSLHGNPASACTSVTKSFVPHPAFAGTKSAMFMPIPKLFDKEHLLLSINGGCYKCPKFWAGHIGACCMAPPIDRSKYKTLTARDVPPRPAGYLSWAAPAIASVSAIPQVTAVLTKEVEEEPAASDLDYVSDCSPLPSVSVVLPNVSSWANDGSWTDDECAPFSCLNNF